MGASPPLRRTRELFLRLVCICYCAAFASLYVQWDGLFGYDGLEPAKTTLTKPQFRSQIGKHTIFSWASLPKPTLLVLHDSHFGLGVDLMAELLCVVGMVCSFLGCCFPRSIFGTAPSLLVSQICYLSLYVVGGTFLSFQWDILLLEVGALATLWAPWLPLSMFPSQTFAFSLPSHAVVWMIRLALFKLMFMSGVVKINADGPTWKGLTALDFHYATQCIPTPLAWFAHQLPPLIQQISVAATLVIEIPGAFLLISPLLSLRCAGAALQVILMVFIALTGNYNFFNFITIVLCIACVDDDVLRQCIRCCRKNRTSGSASANAGSGNSAGKTRKSKKGKKSTPENKRLESPLSPFCSALEVRGLVPSIEHLCAQADADFKEHGWSGKGYNRLLLFCFGILPLFLASFCMFEVAPARGSSSELPSDDPSISIWDGIPLGRRLKLKDWLTRRYDNTNRWNFLIYVTSVTMVGLKVLLVTLMALKEAVRASAVCFRKAVCDAPRKGCRTTGGESPGARKRPDCWCNLARSISASTLRCAHAWCMLAGVLAILMAASTTYVSISEPVRTWIPSWVVPWYSKWLSPWQIASGYGLFRRMTGTDDSFYGLGYDHPISVPARPEVSIQGLDPRDNKWYEIPFKWKPNVQGVGGISMRSAKPSQAPRPGPFKTKKLLPGVDVVESGVSWVAPHQPRLDWQMWFAALGTYESNPWIIVLADKLLEGSPAVYSLLADHDVGESRVSVGKKTAGTRFRPSHPPKMIRMVKTYLDFTRWNTSWSRRVPKVELISERNQNVWYRRSVGKNAKAVPEMYIPSIPKGDASVTKLLTQQLKLKRLENEERVSIFTLDNTPGWRCQHNLHDVGPKNILSFNYAGIRLDLSNSHLCSGLTAIKRAILSGRLPIDPLGRGWFGRVIGKPETVPGQNLRRQMSKEILDSAAKEGGAAEIVAGVVACAAIVAVSSELLGGRAEK